MTWQARIREAWLNTVSGTARVAALASLALVLGIALNLAELVGVRSIDDEARAFQASGASISILSSEGGVDGRRCEALSRQPGVRAAGAIRRGAATAFVALPTISLPTFEVSPAFPALLVPTTDGHERGVFLSENAAEAVGAAGGDMLQTRDGSVRIRGIYPYPDDGRSRLYGYAALVPVPAEGRFDACWVDQWPHSAAMERLLRGTLVPGGADDPNTALTQLNSRLGQELDADSRFRHRPTAWSATLAFLLAFAIAAAAVRLRRLELVASLHLGLTHGALLGITLSEATLWLTPSATTGAALATVFAATGSRADVVANLWLGVSVPLFLTVGGLLGTAAAVLLLREDQLFSYFKNR